VPRQTVLVEFTPHAREEILRDVLRYGYDRRVAAGVIAASGTLAQLEEQGIVIQNLVGFCDQSGGSNEPE
jgi:TRAP-type mannitol/chloroaromatic compound transport system permease large subunit